MKQRNYNPTDAASIFEFSSGLLDSSLAAAVQMIDSSVNPEQIKMKGKGGLGQLVEKFYYGYQPNSDSDADFKEAGVELKTTPLKKNSKDELVIKERLVCGMIDFCKIVDDSFENSSFYKKSQLMLILFYLHVKGYALRDLEFLFSVLWKLDEKDLIIIKRDYEIIVGKIRRGLAHELSEGDTMYLAACRKGQKGDSLRKQPFSEIGAPKRAFSLKPAYMRTLLEFVQSSGGNMATNTEIKVAACALVSSEQLKEKSFEHLLTERLLQFQGQDYKQIAAHFNMKVSENDKAIYARITKRIMHDNLQKFEDAEEIRKAGIIVKTIRVEKTGRIKEAMSFENINYATVCEEEEWIESRWYEIVTSRFMFVVFQEVDGVLVNGQVKKRYILDKVLFWTMPTADLLVAENYWSNIRENVLSDTLSNEKNTFWRAKVKQSFHVRPKARTSAEKYISPISGMEVPKKAYWFNNEYVQKIVAHT